MMINRHFTLLAVFVSSTSLAPLSYGYGSPFGQQEHRPRDDRKLFDASTNLPRVHVDLAEEYQTASEEHPLAEEMYAIAANADNTINAFVALECGLVVAEDYKDGFDETTLFHLWSMTKSWSALMFGIMEKEGIISLNETLEDIWPDPDVWAQADNPEARKNITMEHLLQMRAGLTMPDSFNADIRADVDLFNRTNAAGGVLGRYTLGGRDFNSSLNYHPIASNRSGLYEYLPAGNLISHVTNERAGMTPEEYANEKVFPFVGITSDDYEWYKNFDEVNLGFHGIKMNVRSASKMGMLYLQGGMANENDRIIDQSWIDRSHTVGDASEEATPFGFMWWLGTEPAFCTYGFLGQRVCLNYRTNRVIATFSENIDFLLAYNGSDPNQPWPTDVLVDMFIFDEPAEPVDCLMTGNVTFPTTGSPVATPTAPPVADNETDSSAFNVGYYSCSTALMLAGFVAALFLKA